MEASTWTPFQIMIMVFGGGIGVSVLMGGIRLYINSMVHRALFDKDENPRYVPVRVYETNTEKCQSRLCQKIDGVKNDVHDMKTDILNELKEMNRQRDDARKEFEDARVKGAGVFSGLETDVKNLKDRICNIEKSK